MTRKSQDFHEILSFLESGRVASRKLLGCVESILECLRVYRNDLWTSKIGSKNDENSRFLAVSRFSLMRVHIFTFSIQIESYLEEWLSCI